MRQFETDNLSEFTEEFLREQLQQKRDGSSSGQKKKSSEFKNPFAW
jgi:hypothetical protein